MRGSTHAPKFVDFFCGIGGASQGAADAGYEVVLAVDSWADALSVHKKNHPDAFHICTELPSTMSMPLPTSGQWHLHGSPPCTKLSQANRSRTEQQKTEAVDLVKWYLAFALESGATSWSMEQVASKDVISAVEELMHDSSPFKGKLDYTIIYMHKVGIPQTRKRLIAGSPAIVSRARNMPRRRCAVRDVIPVPRGTHVRNETYNSWIVKRHRDGSETRTRVNYRMDQLCVPIDEPAPTITASNGLRWASPQTGVGTTYMTPRELALLQTFPECYTLPQIDEHAKKAVGNAVPPLLIANILKRSRPERPDTPSLRWARPQTEVP